MFVITLSPLDAMLMEPAFILLPKGSTADSYPIEKGTQPTKAMDSCCIIPSRVQVPLVKM